MVITLATSNQDKIREIEQLIGREDIQFRSMAEAGFNEEIIENGKTYQENALIKAKAVFQVVGGYVLADDSGLSIDLLEGAPGIYSARFAGSETTYPEKIKKIWQILEQWPKSAWTAAFHCCFALITPEAKAYTFPGICQGLIINEMRGSNGFGYDPIFYLPELNCTTAEMTAAEKNKISHRGQAAAKLSEFLANIVK